MDFQKFDRILGDIMFLWVISWGGILLICKKKKQILKKVKKLGVCISIILLAASFILNIVRSTVSFPSLEEAVSFYGKTKQHGQALVGEKTAFVPEFGGMLELNVFDKKIIDGNFLTIFFPMESHTLNAMITPRNTLRELPGMGIQAIIMCFYGITQNGIGNTGM